MGKGIVIVVVYSAILVTLFGVFCYLMTTVNPDPITTVTLSPPDRFEEDISPSIDFRVHNDNEKLKSPKSLQAEVTSLKDFLSKQLGALGYGMEKADPRRNYIEESDSRRNDHTTIQQPNPNIKSDTTTSSYFYFVPDPNRTSNPTRDSIKEIPTNKTIIKENIAIPLLKKVSGEERERRCISEIKPKTGIIFKVIDHAGSVRLTIKVEADAFEAINSENENYDILEGKPHEQNFQNMDTAVIEILPNSSLNLNKRDDSSVLLDLATKNLAILNINKRTLEIMKSVSSTSNTILQALKTEELVFYNATNTTTKS